MNYFEKRKRIRNKSFLANLTYLLDGDIGDMSTLEICDKRDMCNIKVKKLSPLFTQPY
jgi:hypothetical protein